MAATPRSHFLPLTLSQPTSIQRARDGSLEARGHSTALNWPESSTDQLPCERKKLRSLVAASGGVWAQCFYVSIYKYNLDEAQHTLLGDSFLAALSLSRVFMARMERSGGDADTLRLVVVGVWLLQGKNI